MSSILKVDTINEVTSANGVTVDGLSIKDSKLVTADSVVTANITNSNITVGKMAANSVDSDQYVDGSIDTIHIADDQITLAKMAPGTDGNIISYDTSGNPVAVATGSSGQVLTSAGAGAVPSFQALAGGFTLLGTLTTNSGTSQTLGSLSLGSYKFLFISLNNVGGDSVTTLKAGGINITASNGTATHSFWGTMIIDLTTSSFSNSFASDLNTTGLRENAGAVRAGNIGYGTGDSSIVFTLSAGSFSRGTIKIYGAK